MPYSTSSARSSRVIPTMVSWTTAAARRGAKAALRLRHDFGIPRDGAVDPFYIAEKMEVQVRYMALSSLEGMYARSPGPLVMLSTQRPRGRRYFTLGHELGHHYFDHGTQVDEYVDGSADEGSEEERLANAFSRHLLMAAPAVRTALAAMAIEPSTLTPQEAYRLSSYFGVAYSALVNHLCWSMRLISANQVQDLLRVQPAKIKLDLTGEKCNGIVEVVDESWVHRPLDLRVDDLAILPDAASVRGNVLETLRPVRGGLLVRAVRPGIGQVSTSSWAVFSRVEPHEFVGIAKYRYLERDDED